MGHYITGIVSDSKVLEDFASTRELHMPANLCANGLSFLPLSDDHLDVIIASHGNWDEAMTYLSEGFKEILCQLSLSARVAYIETEYFGGEGSQGATVYEGGICIMKPVTNDERPVSDAMLLLGVKKSAKQYDEFEAAGFCRHRNNDDWIEEANEI